METVLTTPWPVMAWPTAKTSLMRSSPTVVSGTFPLSVFNHILVVDICNLSLYHFPSGSQPTVCVRRVTDGVWTAAAWGTAPGATGRTTAETILMKSSVTVSPVFWFNKFFPPEVRWHFLSFFFFFKLVFIFSYQVQSYAQSTVQHRYKCLKGQIMDFDIFSLTTYSSHQLPSVHENRENW